MNLEFNSASNPAMNGLRGITPTAENSGLQQTVRCGKSNHFRDLMNQSKNDIKRAENQTKTVSRENPKNDNVQEAVDQSGNDQICDDAVSVKTESQAEDTQTEAMQEEGSQDNNLRPILENGQQNLVQNFQGGLDAVRSNFNLKLNMGLENNEVQVDVTNQAGQGQVTVAVNQLQEQQAFGIAMQSENTPTQEDANGTMLGNDSQIAMEKAVGNIQNSNPEATMEEQGQMIRPIKSQGLEGQVSQQGDLVKEALLNGVNSVKTDSEDVQATDNNGEMPVNEEVTEKMPVKTEDKNTQILQMTQTLNEALTAQITGGQLKSSDSQTNAASEDANQNLGDKGIQGNPLTGINVSKSAEVQANTNVPVTQQVEQKILQNYEVNKPVVFQMTLSPENLGDIDVQLKYDQGKLIIDIMALSKETQNLLGKEINQLVRSLALQNVKVESVNLNTPVEASSGGQNSESLMNSGSDFTQQQNNARLRENFARNSFIQKSLLQASDEDIIQGVAQNLQYNGYRRINYLI